MIETLNILVNLFPFAVFVLVLIGWRRVSNIKFKVRNYYDLQEKVYNLERDWKVTFLKTDQNILFKHVEELQLEAIVLRAKLKEIEKKK